jgi:hypothetical protein
MLKNYKIIFADLTSGGVKHAKEQSFLRVSNLGGYQHA